MLGAWETEVKLTNFAKQVSNYSPSPAPEGIDVCLCGEFITSWRTGHFDVRHSPLTFKRDPLAMWTVVPGDNLIPPFEPP